MGIAAITQGEEKQPHRAGDTAGSQGWQWRRGAGQPADQEHPGKEGEVWRDWRREEPKKARRISWVKQH